MPKLWNLLDILAIDLEYHYCMITTLILYINYIIFRIIYIFNMHFPI